METDSFRHEYDLGALTTVRPRGHAFEMAVTPRYRYHYEGQEYERYTARFLARSLAGRSLFVDVGANYGFYTLLAATEHPQLEILALEPVEETFRALEQNVQALGLSKVQLRRLAAAEADGEASFHISMAADNCGFSPHPAAPPLRQVAVRTARLDSLLANRAPCPLLVKIDVEGHELSVLRGMKETFSRFPDLGLLVELNPEMQDAAGAKPGELLQELDRLGFAVFLLDEERCRHYSIKAGSDPSVWLSRLHYANLYCVRKETALSVCLFSHSSYLGGAERFLLELVGGLISDHGALCSVVLPGPGPLADALERAGAACLCTHYEWWGVLPPAKPGPQALRGLEPQLQQLAREVLPAVGEIDPDFVWTQTLTIPWGAITAALLGKPHVWSVLEYGELDHGIRFFAPLSRILDDIMTSSTLVYACGKQLGETLFQNYPTDAWRVLYPNIRIPEPAAKPSPTGLFRRQNATRLGMFATLQEGKGQEDAIRAVAELVKEGREVELLLAGFADAVYLPRLEGLIAQHGLGNHVRIAGFLPDQFQAMRETDVVLVCSRLEALGRVGIEAMLLGKPVVYAAAGGLLEYMVDGSTGISYPPGDISTLARVLGRLLDEPETRAALGAQARQHVSERFTRDNYCGKVYRELLALKALSPAAARMPSVMQPLAASIWSSGTASVRERETLRATLQQREAETVSLRQAVASMEAWQRHWARRVFHRWHPPGTRDERDGSLKLLERRIRQRRKRLTASLRRFEVNRFFLRQFNSVRKRNAETRQFLLRLAIRARLTPRLRQLDEAQKLIASSGLIDAAWYLEEYPEAQIGRPEPILHYLLQGARKGYEPNALFDSAWYSGQNRDLAVSGLTPLEHYIRIGAPAGRDPSPRFHGAWYFAEHPEAREAATTPLGHFLQRGQAAGFRPAADTGLSPTSRYANPSVSFSPEVTVIVPNYNHALYLRQRLDSIFQQTYRNFKVLLLDDGSTDGSRAILEEYASRFSDRTHVLFNPANSGCGFAQWSKGLQEARSELVWIAESDDYCDLNFLETLIPFFRDEAVQLAYCDTMFVGPEGQALDFSFASYTSALDPSKWKSSYVETAHREVRQGLGIRNTIPNVSAVLLRHPGKLPLLKNANWLKMRSCGDWVFYLHHARGGKIAFTRDTRSYYRYHPANASRKSYRTPEFYQEHEEVGKTVARLYRVEPGLFEKQRQFLRDHWGFVFRDESPSWSLDDFYHLGRIRAELGSRLPNVLMVGYDFATGGGEVFAIRLACALRERGYGVTFYDFNGQEANPEFRRLLPAQIPLIERNEHDWEVNKLIEDFGTEIVHTHHGSTDHYFAVRLPPGGAHPPHIVTMHGMYEAMDLTTGAEHLKQLAAAVDHWVYVADKNLQPFKEHQLYNPSKFTKAGYGMERPEISPLDRAALGIGQEAFVICVASRAIPEKGWPEAIRAVEVSRSQTGRDIHLVLVGNGPVWSSLSASVLPAYVHLLGFKPNPVDYYAMADLGLLATRYASECRPLTIIECLMAGRPVIATDVGEIRNMVTAPDGSVAGALVALQNGEVPIAALSAAISKLATDKTAYGEAHALTPLLAEQFEMDHVFRQYAEIYAKALARPVPDFAQADAKVTRSVTAGRSAAAEIQGA